MTRKEKLAYEYGKTFTPADGKDAPCYDDRMHSLVTEARSLTGTLENIRVCDAWWAGRATADTFTES